MSPLYVVWCFSMTISAYAFDNYLQGINKHKKNMLPDILLKTDLETYVGSIEQLVNFYVQNANEIDVNSVFGFFLMNVNLNSALHKKAKDLPLVLANRFKNIVQKNIRLVAYFRMMASQSQVQSPRHKKLKKIATLFSNESLWVSRTKHVDSKQIVDSSPLDYKEVMLHFSSWPEYKEEIDNIGRMMPPFALTEKCLLIVAENPVHYGNSTPPQCIMPPECRTGISAGNDIGFALTNRLLVLIQARFARHCTILSEKEDAELVDKLCSTCYKEAAFISMNKYNPVMLLIEQLTLCTLNGNVEFLRRPWLSYILALQTEYGCFSDLLRRKKPVKPVPNSRWSLDKENQHQPQTFCFGPASAGAAAVLSAAVKYILELYY